VPIITSTATSTGFVSESVQYVDVGIKLNVEPAVHYDDEIEIKVAVEVSSLVSEVRTRTTLAYQIGTRSASTTLRLKDGETQILAGLISSAERTNANRIPGLGDLPVAGRLFSSQRDSNQRTEVILAITPRLVRAARAPSASMTEFWSGTETTLRLSPLTLEPKASATGVDRGATAPGAGGTPVGDPTGSAGFSVIRSTPPAASSAGVTSGLPGPGGPPSLGGPSAPGSAAQEWASGVTRRVARQVETLLLGPANAQVGALFEATVRLKADGGVRALPLQIAFDPAKLQVVEVREGDYFKQDGGQTTFAHQVAPETGRILISAQRNGGEGVRGEDAVATIRFRAVAPGSTKVAVSTANAVGLEGQAPSTVLAVPLEITIK
jgi:general secretion pathway protein D